MWHRIKQSLKAAFSLIVLCKEYQCVECVNLTFIDKAYR